jgi:WhiB family redox-sensing transcriptional regulator
VREPRFYEDPSCASVGGDFWFPERSDNSSNSAEMVIAKSICGQCIHKTECAEWGLKKERFGIWGGTSEYERRLLRRRLNIVLKEENVA